MREICLTVVNDDVCNHLTDVLVLKHAQAFYGADLAIAEHLRLENKLPNLLRLFEGQTLWVDNVLSLPSQSVLFVGTPPIAQFEYAEMRELSHLALQVIANQKPFVSKVALTIHGSSYGLDPHTALQALIDGLTDALRLGYFSDALQTIEVVEIDNKRADLLAHALEQIMGQGILIVTENRGPLRLRR